jgi:CRISPR-associated endonuclease Cas1
MTSAIDETFSRQSTDPRVLVIDGHGVSITVHRRELHIIDGMCGRGRERTLAKVDHHVKRIVMIGKGHITTQALEWMRGVSTFNNGTREKEPMSFVMLSADGEPLVTSASTPRDVKLRRAQSRIADRPEGLQIYKYLQSQKFAGHELTLPGWDASTWVERLYACRTVDEGEELEAEEHNAYFAKWRGMPVQFDTDRVPERWLAFTTRNSRVNRTTSNRNAADAINALLNYCFHVAKSETLLACHVHGLDPDFAISHADRNYAHPMALDLVEAIRPMVEAYVLDLVKSRVFTRTDFAETKNGTCRVLRPLTNELSEQALRWHAHITPVVKEVKNRIMETVEGDKRISKRDTGTAKKTGPKKRRATIKAA